MTSGCIGQVYFCIFSCSAPARLVLAMGVLCDHRVSNRQRKCARDYGCNVFSHFVWL